MPDRGRSLDDLPLAAYSTGVDPETEPAAALAVDPTDDVAPGTGAAALAPQPGAAAPGAAPLGNPFGDPPAGAAAPANAVARTVAVGSGDASAAPPFAELFRNPRAHVRDPRLLLTGVIGLGVVLLAVSLFAGSANVGGTALASPTPPGGPVITAAPVGSADVHVTGALTGSFTLAGVTGSGRAGATMNSTWGDTAGELLALSGPVTNGTRTTDGGFVLSWTVTIDGKAVLFTSKAGECTVGMADKPSTVTGSFVCDKVKSADGKYTLGVRGTYKT